MPLYYTRAGDTGKTSLFDATRIGKDNLRIEAFGSVDELNSFIGVARTFSEDKEIDSVLEKIQKELFIVGADLLRIMFSIWKRQLMMLQRKSSLWRNLFCLGATY
jgi:cob(I)alamin adenosyltransferase